MGVGAPPAGNPGSATASRVGTTHLPNVHFHFCDFHVTSYINKFGDSWQPNRGFPKLNLSRIELIEQF